MANENRPSMNHPINDLIIQGGQIYRKARFMIEPYMNTTPIKVALKQRPLIVSDDKSQIHASLNNFPDAIWQRIFRNVLKIPGVEAESRMLVVTARREDLESRWASVENAINEANAWYAEEQRSLSMKIQERD
jgi:hypothetical protein